MAKIFFTIEEDKIVKDLIELYYKTKKLTLILEQVSFEHKTNPQILVEIRNAFDHLMKVLASKYKLMGEFKNSPKYAFKHLDKSYGHVYRAGYDALDVLNVVLEEIIKDQNSEIEMNNAFKVSQQNSYLNIFPSNPCFEVWYILHYKEFA